jgi:hypothetical protein
MFISCHLSGINHGREEQIHDQMTKLQTLVRTIQNEDSNHSKEIHRHKIRSRQLSHALPVFDDEEDSSRPNGQGNGQQMNNNNNGDDEADETSGDSDQTTVGPCTFCLQERTEEITTKHSHGRRSTTGSNHTDRSHSALTISGDGGADKDRRLGEALASNGTEIIYYDYKQKMICLDLEGVEQCSVKFLHGLVVDLYWWEINDEWLILSEQGIYRWKTGEDDYRDAYEFTNGEIGFRRIAVTSKSIFCLFRYSSMLLELTNSMQMKRLHALAPYEARYRKLADISVRKIIRSDGNEEDILGITKQKKHIFLISCSFL